MLRRVRCTRFPTQEAAAFLPSLHLQVHGRCSAQYSLSFSLASASMSPDAAIEQAAPLRRRPSQTWTVPAILYTCSSIYHDYCTEASQCSPGCWVWVLVDRQRLGSRVHQPRDSAAGHKRHTCCL